jgi:hypothetical protein
MSASVSINRVRGDTVPESFTMKLYDAQDSLIDITTLTTMTLTVNSDSEPPDATNELLQLSGTVVSAPDSLIEFSGAWDTLPVGELYYDVQVSLSSGKLWTPFRGILTVSQDINKD